MNHLPPSPWNNIRVISNFFEKFGDIRKSRCTTGINDTGAAGVNYWCCWYRSQIMGKISGCRFLKWTWRQKFIYVISTTKGVQTKKLKFSWLKNFRIWNSPNGTCMLRGWGETIHEKNQKSKLVALSLSLTYTNGFTQTCPQMNFDPNVGDRETGCLGCMKNWWKKGNLSRFKGALSLDS